ncbi:TonB-dependent receptor [Segetibacter sp. 3557_3]|nr:TonB-dependent receptor [Segetibacter sp. 3557_3]
MKPTTLQYFSFSILFISSLCSLSASARQVELDPVTVTSSLVAVKTSQSGRNIIVVPGAQFRHLPVNSIDEFLRYLPGLEVQMRGPMGAQSDFVLRGGTFQQVLVVLDGIRINDPNTGHFSSYIPISPSEIERVEILKGAASAIYGSEAVGGVIHVITKTFAARRNNSVKRMAGQVAAGGYGLVNGQLGGDYQAGSTAISGGVVTNNAEGQQQRGTKGYVHNTTASISAMHFFNDHLSLAVRSAFDKRNFAAQNFYTIFASDTATEKVQSFWNQARLSYSKQAHRLDLHLGYKSVVDDYRFSPSATANSNKSQLLQALATHQWQADTKTSLTSGLQWLGKSIRSNDRGNHSLQQAGVFSSLNRRFGNLNLNVAVRGNWNERSGWELVPQLNTSVKISDWQLRAVAGKTTRDADFTERFNNYNKAFVASGSIGNANLKPEHSFSYEVGADYYGFEHFKLAATVFRQEFSNLIDYVPTPYAQMPRRENLSATGTYALAKNITGINNTGFETDLVYDRMLEGDKQLSGSVGLTLINTQSNNQPPSFYVSSHAKLITNIAVRYTTRAYSIGINGLYKEREPRSAAALFTQTSKAYFLMNIKVQGYLYQDKMGVYIQADNVFNKTYSDLLGAQMPGRWLMAGLTFSFSG